MSLHAQCDAGTVLAAEARGASDHPNMVLATTILASSLAFVDGSVVNVGLPAIGQDLHGGALDLQWIINAYLLPLSALILFGGAAGDRFGRRRLLIFGIALFGAASAAIALSPSLAWMLAARTVQGVGAAILLPNSLAVLGGAFSDKARGAAVGTWAAASAITGAVGPVLGGWLIDTVGWRAIFLLNLPLAAAAILMAVRYVRDGPVQGDRRPLDTMGAALATLGLAGVTWGLTLGSGAGGWTAEAIGALVGGLLLSAAFVGVERRRGDRAMMPLALFGSANFIGLTLLTVLLYGAFGGLLVLLPFVLIRTAGYSATAAGAALLPLPLLIAVVSPLMGGIAARIGSRIPLTAGALVVAVGLLLMMRVGQGAGYWTTTLPAVLVMSLGMSMAVAPLTTAVLASVDAQHRGSASGFNSAAARAGGLAATALLGAVLAAQGPALLAAFRAAAVAGAIACVLAAASAFLLTADDRSGPRRA
jgi:EmrB/QacA subfamily drug resistance transporter